jgi:hypothetical protein
MHTRKVRGATRRFYLQARCRYNVRNAAATMRTDCCIQPVAHSSRMPASKYNVYAKSYVMWSNILLQAIE